MARLGEVECRRRRGAPRRASADRREPEENGEELRLLGAFSTPANRHALLMAQPAAAAAQHCAAFDDPCARGSIYRTTMRMESLLNSAPMQSCNYGLYDGIHYGASVARAVWAAQLEVRRSSG